MILIINNRFFNLDNFVVYHFNIIKQVAQPHRRLVFEFKELGEYHQHEVVLESTAKQNDKKDIKLFEKMMNQLNEKLAETVKKSHPVLDVSEALDINGNKQ